MRRFLIFMVDPRFVDSWMHVATVNADAEDQAMESVRRFPELRFKSLMAREC